MAAPVGNQNAKRAKRWEAAITRALAKVELGMGVEAGLDKCAAQLVDAAVKGEQWALRELGDRIDGKVAQPIGGSDDLPPLQFEKLERVLVRPNPDDSNR